MKTSIIVKEMKKEYLRENRYLCYVALNIIYVLDIINFQSEEEQKKHERSIINYINRSIEYRNTVYSYLLYKKDLITTDDPVYLFTSITDKDCHDFRLQLLDEMIDFFTKEENDHEL